MRKLLFLLILFLTGSFTASAQDVTFKASAPATVINGQQFRLTYSTNKPGKDLRIADLTGFDVLFTANQESHNSVLSNGQYVTIDTYSMVYTLVANKEGTFTIPPATIKVGNSEYKSNPVTIKVLPKDKADDAVAQQAQSGSASGINNESLFVRMHVTKSSVYENEGFLVTFKLYSLYDVRSFENIKFPEFEGFLSQDIELSQDRSLIPDNYNGRNYLSFVLKQVILYPQRSGNITIGSGKYDVIVQIRNQQQVRSIFDGFLDSYSPVKKALTSAPVTINVKPLPAGKPASFSGALGDYNLKSSISSNNVKANEAITVKVNISGNGNIKLIRHPEIAFPNDFDTFDPKVDVPTKVTTAGVSGNKIIEYTAIPRYAGDFIIPKAEFSYFDIKSGTYKTLYTEEFKLHVEPGAGGASSNNPAIFNATNKEDLKLVGQDIRYIKTNEVYYSPKGNAFYGSLTFWLSYIIPTLLFIIFFIIYRKQAAENSNIALVRTKKANKVASKRLKLAGKLLKENRKEEFYDEVLKAVWGYLSDKLNIPVASLTKDNVEVELGKYGIDESLITRFMDILNTCEFARYAPAQDASGMDQLYEETVQTIDKMENTIKK
ncbi:MAG: BatD family protein [Dysgonamonadaceae bacterium]|nr:BatD family protein [Dysgonamonadaceae bacterium]